MGQPRATTAVIRNAIKAAQECGIDVGVVEVSNDGAVRILAQRVDDGLPSPESPPKWPGTG